MSAAHAASAAEVPYYPPIEPYATGFLGVDSGHRLYYEECGNAASPHVALFLHGGPAAGFSPRQRRFFDPQFFRIVLLDQRGAGKSTPSASLENNTTWSLVADLEALRAHLQLDAWALVFGGSWGSTLALAYAETHPARVRTMVLRGTFLFRREDMLWLFQHGASEIYPDMWKKYVEPIPLSERDDLLRAYYRRLTSPDDDVRLMAARRFVEWESNIAKLHNDQAAIQASLLDVQFFEPFARAECHFFVHGGWFDTDTWLLDNVDKIADKPIGIVHGRFDIVCRPCQSQLLHDRLRNSTLTYTFAGHSDSEPETARQLLAESNRMRDLLRSGAV